LKEQVIAQKVGNRTGIGKAKANVGQRPARRDRETGQGLALRLRSLVGYIPLALRIGKLFGQPLEAIFLDGEEA